MSIDPGPIGRIDTAMRLFVSYWPTVSLSHCHIVSFSSRPLWQMCLARQWIAKCAFAKVAAAPIFCRQWGILLCKGSLPIWQKKGLDSSSTTTQARSKRGEGLNFTRSMLIIPSIEAPLC